MTTANSTERVNPGRAAWIIEEVMAHFDALTDSANGPTYAEVVASLALRFRALDEGGR